MATTFSSSWFNLYYLFKTEGEDDQIKIALDMLEKAVQSNYNSEADVKNICYLACMNHDLQLVKFLVERKYKGIPTADKMLISVLWDDSNEYTGELLQYMLDQGADPTKMNNSDRMYLTLSGRQRSPVVREFIEKYVKPPVCTFFSNGTYYEYTYGEKTGTMTTLGPDGLIKTNVGVHHVGKYVYFCGDATLEHQKDDDASIVIRCSGDVRELITETRMMVKKVIAHFVMP